MCEQERERFYWDGQEYLLYGEPALIRHPRIVLSGEQPIGHTGCYRGYIGTWLLQDGNLFLASIEGPLKVLGYEPLFASWVTHSFLVNKSKRLIRSEWDERVRIEIVSGVLQSVTPEPEPVIQTAIPGFVANLTIAQIIAATLRENDLDAAP